MLESWNYRWFGFFRNRTTDGTDSFGANLPDIVDLVGAAWSPDEKRKVMSYLQNSPVVVTTLGPGSPCELCDAQLPNSSFQSDGHWLWPEALSHYLDAHDIALPGSFVAHMREADFVAPQDCNVAIQDLPWPS